LWILDPNQVAFEVATRLRAKKFIVLDTLTLPQIDGSDSLEMTTESVQQWLKKNPDFHPVTISELFVPLFIRFKNIQLHKR